MYSKTQRRYARKSNGHIPVKKVTGKKLLSPTPCIRSINYEGRSKSFATQYDAQMTQAKFLCYYSTQSPLTPMHMLHLLKSSFMPVK